MTPPVAPVTVEVITYTPTEYYHCTHCEVVWQSAGLGQKVHAEQRVHALPADLALQYQQLGAWAERLLAQFGNRLIIRVVDAASPEGFFKSLRYRVYQYPAFIVRSSFHQNGSPIIGADFQRVTERVTACLAEAEQQLAHRLPSGERPAEVHCRLARGGKGG